MKRPQSAKYGHRPLQAQPSSDDFREDDSHSRNINRMGVKMMKPDLTTNDFARILPKKIYQDKQRLYSETLQLKQVLNEIKEENVRLKTRISILEKEKEKLNRYIESTAETTTKGQHRFNLYNNQNKTGDKDNMMVRNLKKMIRESKDQNEYLKQENAKIKKAIKYTKINELQIQRKMLIDQNRKLSQILEDMNEQLADQDQYVQEINELKGYLEEQVQNNKDISESNQKYIEYIEELEDKIKKQSDKAQEKEKKLQRQIHLQKRKWNESEKITHSLREELKTIKQSHQDIKKKTVQKALRPVSSNPYNKKPEQQKKKFDELKQKNENLEKQLEQAKMKLERSQAKLKEQYLVKKDDEKNEKQNKKENEKKDLKLDSDDQEQEQSEYQNNQFILQEEKKISNKQIEEEKYDDEFEDDDKKDDQNFQIKEYQKKFEAESGQEQKLYQKEDEKQLKEPSKGIEAKSKNHREQQKKEKEKGKKTKGYKPDKKIMSEIKQLLTYRMKAQRYPYEQLQTDIHAAEEKNFMYEDLQKMMKQEPFYLIPRYTKPFLQYAFEKEKINKNEIIPADKFLKKMRKVIDNFTLPPEEQEEEMLLRIAQMTTTYPSELENAFEKIKNGPETVPKEKLVEMFSKLELAENYIELIISELSLCSEDLQHLNFHSFFERFYIEREELQQAIDEEQIESSGEERRKTPKQPQSHHLKAADQEDKIKFDAHDAVDLSMGKGNQNYDYDVVDDDGYV